MLEKQTLYDYLYTNLRELIVSGRITYGHRFPSISELCEFYNIGIRTVKDVIRTLKEEGYIETKERKASIVIYQYDKRENEAKIAKYILEHELEIITVYQTMALIIPEITAFSVMAWNKADLNCKVIEKLHDLNAENIVVSEKVYVEIIYELLVQTNNRLLSDLFTNLDMYARPVYFIKQKNYIDYLKDKISNDDIIALSVALIKQDKKEIVNCLETLYQQIIMAVEKTIFDLNQHYPATNISQQSYLWNAERGRKHLYIQIIRDLIDKIFLGTYPQETFLPHEAQLAEIYGVGVSTIRKSLKIMNDFGLCKTMNVLGTKVEIKKGEFINKLINNKHYQQDLMTYLYALQTMLILFPIAVKAANIDSSKIKQLEEIINSDKILIECLIDFVIENVLLLPFKQILSEINDIIHWGYYYALYFDEDISTNIINLKSEIAYNQLCKGNTEQFINEVTFCFKHTLVTYKDCLIEYGLNSAKNIIIPE